MDEFDNIEALIAAYLPSRDAFGLDDWQAVIDFINVQEVLDESEPPVLVLHPIHEVGRLITVADAQEMKRRRTMRRYYSDIEDMGEQAIATDATVGQYKTAITNYLAAN